jgi:hypothetical protein
MSGSDFSSRPARTDVGSTWWARWKRLAHRAAEIQAYILLSVLYVVLVIPIGLVRRALVKSTVTDGWQKRPFNPNADRLQEARQQF